MWRGRANRRLSAWRKHSKLEEAEEVLRIARNDLQFFSESVRALPQMGELRIDIGSFLVTADYLLDGLLVDYLVYSRIAEVLERVDDAISQIRWILEELRYRNGGY